MNEDLIYAVRSGNLEYVRNCLERGADIEEKDSSGDSLLNEAARKGHIEIVRLLIEKGARLEVPNSRGQTALKWAEENAYPEIAHLLRNAMRQTQATETWAMIGPDRAAFVGVYPGMQKKLTDIFNFAQRERLIITDDLETRAEAVAPLVSFEDLPTATLENALAQFTRLGGVADRDFVLRGITRLNKTSPGPLG